MNRRRALRNSERGLTLVELIIAVAIIGILLAFASLSYDVLKANLRFSKVRADMDAIAKSAYNDYSTTNVWAPLTFAAMPANWAANGELSKWPAAPCPGWYYSWEDWSVFGFPVTQVTVRRGDNSLLWGFCLDTSGGSTSCQVADPIFGGSGATDINATGTHSAYCSE